MVLFNVSVPLRGLLVFNYINDDLYLFDGEFPSPFGVYWFSIYDYSYALFDCLGGFRPLAGFIGFQ